MEKFFFKKVEMWVVLLLLLLAFLGALAFGYIVRQETLGEVKTGKLSKAAVFLTDMPKNVEKAIKGGQEALKSEETRFESRSGLTIYQQGDLPDDPQYYVLVSRYDGDIRRSVAELMDIGKNKVLHSWQPNFESINAQIKNREDFKEVFRDYSKKRYRMIHPLVLDDGSLVFKAASPLVRVDICGKLIFQNDDLKFHHSIEQDVDGNIWIPATIRPSSIEDFDPKYVDDAIVKLSPDGEVLYQKSVTRILFEHNMQHEMYTYDKFVKDPIHLNDIEPVKEDGPYWKKGDVFISLGHLNMIALFRPSTDKLIWWTQFQMNHQHDIDILNDREISIFDNNRVMRFAKGKDVVKGSNEIQIYNFESGEMRSVFSDSMLENEVRTRSQGLSDFLPDGGIFIEETDHGRLLALNSKGELVWDYVNRNDTGSLNLMNWSRVIPKEYAEKIVALAKNAQCDA